MATLKLCNINKIYQNEVQAVFDFNLNVVDKEFIVLVGPSGCGKSTTLRMIAGLEEITTGEFLIDDQMMNNVAPKDRDIAMVFQSYALYPHMTVFDNMAFALKLQKFQKSEIKEKVNAVAKILGLEDYLHRKPKALSGGQRQRVALGRAIVRNAKVLLMDEPLSNLDAKLRVQMRAEIIKLHEGMGTTTVYVTHDQTEAMTMATRIIVMKDGHIQQIGTPREIYNNPVNIFVGGFIGAPPMNFIEGVIKDEKFISNDFEVNLSESHIDTLKDYKSKEVILGIRPENLHNDDLHLDKYYDNKVTCVVEVSELLGDEIFIYTQIAGQSIIAKVPSTKDVSINDKIDLAINPDKIHFFNKATENVIN